MWLWNASNHVNLSGSGGVGQASRASIIAESAQRRQYVFPFAAWYRVSADFANLSKFTSVVVADHG